MTEKWTGAQLQKHIDSGGQVYIRLCYNGWFWDIRWFAKSYQSKLAELLEACGKGHRADSDDHLVWVERMPGGGIAIAAMLQ